MRKVGLVLPLVDIEPGGVASIHTSPQRMTRAFGIWADHRTARGLVVTVVRVGVRMQLNQGMEVPLEVFNADLSGLPDELWSRHTIPMAELLVAGANPLTYDMELRCDKMLPGVYFAIELRNDGDERRRPRIIVVCDEADDGETDAEYARLSGGD